MAEGTQSLPLTNVVKLDIFVPPAFVSSRTVSYEDVLGCFWLRVITILCGIVAGSCWWLFQADW